MCIRDRNTVMESKTLEPPLDIEAPESAAVSPRALDHRDLSRDDFWRAIPAYESVSAAEFQTHLFQTRHTVTNVRQLRETLQHLVPDSFYEDVVQGLKGAPMALRISPYPVSY